MKTLAIASFAAFVVLAACKKDDATPTTPQQPNNGQYGYPQNGQMGGYPQQPGMQQYPQQPGAPQYPQQPGAYPQQPGAPTMGAPTTTGGTSTTTPSTGGGLATPGPLALPCANDSACGLAHCNTQYGKCAFPCQSANDCITGNTCNTVTGLCLPSGATGGAPH